MTAYAAANGFDHGQIWAMNSNVRAYAAFMLSS